jgi:hypothetical protein
MALPVYGDARTRTGIHPVVADYFKRYTAEHGHFPGRRATLKALEASGVSPHAVRQSWSLLTKDDGSGDEAATSPQEC